MLALFILGGSFRAVEPARNPLTLERGERVVIVLPESLSSREEMAVEDLASFLQRSLRSVVQRHTGNVSLADLPTGTLVVVGTPSGQQLLRQEVPDLHTDSLGEEGCLVRVGSAQNRPLIVLTGLTPAGVSHAVYSFLENELGIGFFIDGNRVPEPERVVLEAGERREVPAVPIRGIFYHPTWQHPHANSWRLWSWERWRDALDWMRRKRFNTLPLMHDSGGYLWGDVLFREFPELKMNDRTLRHFVVDPAWRRKLNQKVFDHARKSGLSIAYNLFYTQVPEFFAESHPELKTYPLNMKNVGISASQPQNREIMKRYWGAILDTYGMDDSHLYFVCSYQHERSLPPEVPDRNQTTIEAYELLRELDPEARVYIETWCWKYRHECKEPYAPCPERNNTTLTENPKQEWEIFNRGVPKEIGVAEWDLKATPGRIPDPTFAGRPYVQLTHTTMEGWWPPATGRRSPRWMIDYFGDSIDNGAEGVLYFHIQANTNMILADLAARIGWEGRPDLSGFYRDYARRRFGQKAASTLAESLGLFCEAVELGAHGESSYGLSLGLTYPGIHHSGEGKLALALEGGQLNEAWLEARLALLRPHREALARSLLLARSLAPIAEGDAMYDRYLFELDYTAARFEGIESLFRAHLASMKGDARRAGELFQQAVELSLSVKEMFRDKPGYHMSEIRNLEPDVPFTKAFLEDWETRGYWQPRVRWFHVVWERLDEFQKKVEELRP